MATRGADAALAGARSPPRGDCGQLIGIARRAARRAPMELLDAGSISVASGLDGDHKGRRLRNRAVTLLSLEAWQEALAELGAEHGGMVDLPWTLPWTVRRANLLVEGVRLPRARGGILMIGPVELEVTYPTAPCRRMDEACPGLLKALHPDWRGGVTARVLAGGRIALGDAVTVKYRPPETMRKLPG